MLMLSTSKNLGFSSRAMPMPSRPLCAPVRQLQLQPRTWLALDPSFQGSGFIVLGCPYVHPLYQYLGWRFCTTHTSILRSEIPAS